MHKPPLFFYAGLFSLPLLPLTSMAVHADSPALAGKIVSAKVIDLDPAVKAWEVGDIEATTFEGKRVVVAKDHTCTLPKVSAHGDVGWSIWTDRDPSNKRNTAQRRYSSSAVERRHHGGLSSE